MILVTLGTQDKQFTRLLQEIDALIEKKVIQEEVIVQAGYTKFQSKNMKIFDYVPKKKLEEYMEKSSFVITHAGVGSIFDCLKKHKKVIAVPRLAKYQEHHNNHQLEIVDELGKQKLILPVYEMSELEKAIQKVKKFKPNIYQSNNQNMIHLIDHYMESVKGKEKRSMKELFKKYREIIMYLIFGVLTTVVSLAVYYILVDTILNPDQAVELQIANILSWIAGVAFAYITNRSMVFQSKNKNKLKEATHFVLARVVTLMMDMVMMFVGVTLLHGNDKILKLISQIVVIVSNYVFSKVFVFQKEK